MVEHKLIGKIVTINTEDTFIQKKNTGNWGNWGKNINYSLF